MAYKTLNNAKGCEYEKFVVRTLQLEYDGVWSWDDTPESLLIENHIITDYDVYRETRQDIGIDAVAVKDGKVTYIQCKNHGNNVRITDLSGCLFFANVNNVDVLVCHSNGISPNIIKQIESKKHIVRQKLSFRHIPFDNAEIE